MNKMLSTVAILMLAGCGGDSFGSGLQQQAPDSGATGDAAEADSGAGGRSGSGGHSTETGGNVTRGTGGSTPATEGADGAASDAGGAATGGTTSTGGASSGGAGGSPVGTGGTSTGGSGGVAGSGGAPTGGTGGIVGTGGGNSTGGTTGTGGGGSCTPVTHDNGQGETWQDCTPLDTINAEQAMKACALASTSCFLGASSSCGVCFVDASLGTGFYRCWGISGAVGGHVFTTRDCTPYLIGAAWH